MNKRNMYTQNIELRAENTESNELSIEGYFAVYDSPTQLFDGYYESISPGAFKRSLEGNDIRCLFDHQSSTVLGRTGNQTLTLRSDDKGLYGKVTINRDDTEAMNIYQRVKRGDISGCSFGFLPVEERSEPYENGVLYRVNEADTVEVSIVTFPAYPDTEIQARSKKFEQDNKKQLEVRRQKLMNQLKGENK